MERISLVCFAASYAAALGLELIHRFRPAPPWRALGLTFAGAGFFAHTAYLGLRFVHPDGQHPLSSQSGSLLFLAWILAVFHLYGSLHHPKVLWGMFVLPLVIGFVLLAWLVSGDGPRFADSYSFRGEAFWGGLHAVFLLLAAVGVSVGFVASVMYLVQSHRLKAKVIPGPGRQLFSLERLEAMNRRAINWSFLLLSVGVVIGIALTYHSGFRWADWADPRVAGATVLWGVYALVMYLRYGAHLPGRRLAQLTIVAFTLLILTLATSHTQFATRGGP